MSITIEEMRTIAQKTLEEAKARLVAENNFDPAIFLAVDSVIVNIPFPGNAMNSGKAKSMLFGVVKLMAKELNADAVVFLSDGWTLEFTDEQRARFSDPEYAAAFERISRDEGAVRCAELGYGELWEVILVTVQSPLLNILVTQLYQRHPTGSPPTFARFGRAKSVEDATGAECSMILVLTQ
jgi:hypothetical protein